MRKKFWVVEWEGYYEGGVVLLKANTDEEAKSKVQKLHPRNDGIPTHIKRVELLNTRKNIPIDFKWTE